MSDRVRPLLTLVVDVAPPVDVGPLAEGMRRTIPITGGTFSGEIAGKILPGFDWQTILADGTIDAIATDHAPHPQALKEQPLDAAPPGMLGLQTALPLALGELGLDLPQVVALLSWRPAAIAGVADRHGGPVRPGSPANITVFDPDATWTVDPGRLASKSRNTPYAGRTLRGQVRHTVFRGSPVVVDGEAQR